MSGSQNAVLAYSSQAVVLVGPILGGSLGSGYSIETNPPGDDKQFLRIPQTYSANTSTGIGAGTGNFTLEFWMKYTDPQESVAPSLIGNATNSGSTSGGGFTISIYNDTVYYDVNNTTVKTFSLAGKSYKGVWSHLALARSSGQTRCYFNGAQIGLAVADTNSISNSYEFVVGALKGNGTTSISGSAYRGLLTNIRWTTACVYTGAFTVPTQPLDATQSAGTNISAITNSSTVRLLLLCTNGIAYDSSPQHLAIATPAGHNPTPSLDGPFN
jgi:hypothetical protein